ncbi:DUF4153 domain-containing protein [Ornithinimicrobium sediminis]|uniref:DUF4153 domain-containing protein n=1 Tax=Ornithinimicrobium sediminis TaxID=2904603 RepID=UPI0022B83CF1|nr:DUF4153 domain-containing protein [Ornithinimicrobium sediminis]
MTPRPSRTDRPLDGVASIKVKIGLLVALSILAAVVVLEVGRRAGVPAWLTLPVTLAAALGVTQWLARGMTSPLREMTHAASRMAGGDYDTRVSATSADEVGRLARAFTTMADDLATAEQQRRHLVATVSHELRTPLAAQRALLENLVDGVVSPDDAALQTALLQSERLSALVADLLDLSRIDGGAVPLHLDRVRVAELLDRTVAEATVSGRPVRLEVAVEPPDLVVRADAARLAQVVANLLDNAMRHNPPDGVVRVRAAAEEDGRWSLEVADDGPGLPAEQARQAFSRFGTGDRSGGGTGLGLAIAGWVCRLHGGSIQALPSRLGSTGATVRALLPRDPEQRPQATPDTVPGGAVVEDEPRAVSLSVADLWPERGPHTAPGPLYASVAVGALAAAVLPYRDIGGGTVLVLLVAGVLVWVLSVHRRRPWTVLAVVLCAGLASLLALRAAEWLPVLVLAVAGLLVSTALTDARGLAAMLSGPAAWVLSGVRGLPLLGRTVSATSRHRLLWPVLRTAAISLLALVVFGGLFATGDAVFGSWVAGILPEVHIAESLVLRTFVWFVVGGVVLAACYLALNPPRVDVVALPPARPVSNAWEWLVPVGVVVAVFAVFLVAQASAMWGGHDFVRRTTGMSYADYVHQGFAQLTVATALTLATVALAVRKAPRTGAGDRRLLRAVLGTLCVLTLVVVASALFRMAVYQEAYGFTVLRVLVDAFEVWLGLLVVLVMVAGVRLSGWWLPRAALASGAALLLAVGLADPEAWVARQNIERFEATGRLDLDYLATLGADAVPVVEEGLPPDLAWCVLGRRDVSSDDALGWNLGRARAADVLAAPWPQPATEDCPGQVGE